jgi:hypothetical protein
MGGDIWQRPGPISCSTPAIGPIGPEVGRSQAQRLWSISDRRGTLIEADGIGCFWKEDRDD